MTQSQVVPGVPNIREPLTNQDGKTASRAWFYFWTVTVFNSTVATGSVLQFAGVTLPNGYLACDGKAVSRATYSALNSIAAALNYGSPYGPGDGVNTFNVPNIATVAGVRSMIKT